MVSGILGILGPIILWGLKKFIEASNMKEQQKKNYYAFLKDVDQHTKVDVTNYIAAGDAREETIARIKVKRLELGIDEKGDKVESAG